MSNGNDRNPKIQAPPKPWDPEMESSAEDLIKFLKDPTSKSALKDFIFETFKQFESERLEQLKARMEHEKQVDSQTPKDFHKTGNIAPLVSEHLNMHETERSFAQAIKATKANLVRSAEERADEISRLLANIGGFSSQLKGCFARSTVVFLEEEDPRKTSRERLIFSVNLPNYELKAPWEDGKADPKARKGKTKGVLEDGRTPMRATWDNAVNALAQIIASTGLKPKYCKNDRNYGRFVMKQDLGHSSAMPDEYFSFTLDYNTAEKIEEMKGPFNKLMARFDKKVDKLSRKLDSYSPDSRSLRYQELKRKYLQAVQERDHFVGTTPDPNQLDEGLLFLIEVSTLKDYHIVKDRMQSIMTKYILHLSRIAAREAEINPELEHEMWKLNNANKPTQASEQKELLTATEEELDALQEYTVDASLLKPVRKGKKAA